MGSSREGQLLLAAYAAGLASPAELANFMAQVSVESSGLTQLEESFRYPGGAAQIGVESARREGDAALEVARLAALDGHPERLAELMYGGRMGNDAAGDGYRYRGRGYIQLTGKANYAAAAEALGLDLVAHPELSLDPDNAARIALWYWRDQVPMEARSDVIRAARSINGGDTGLSDRVRLFAAWERALDPDAMRLIAAGHEPELPDALRPAIIATAKAAVATPLRRTAAGPAVADLQWDLGRLGYLGRAGVDGRFGAQTEAAVEGFQRDQHLAVDGVVGPVTRGRLDAALARAVAAAEPRIGPALSRRSVGGSAVTVLQWDLGRLGYLGSADVDGRFGPRTEAAVAAFQRDQQLAVDGIVGTVTRGSLDTALRRAIAPAEPWIATAALRRGADGAAVVDLQSELGRLGYLGRPEVDGRFDARTEAAVEGFQRDQRVAVDGIVGPVTRGRLDAALQEREALAAAFGCDSGFGGPATGFASPGHPQHPLYATLRSLLPEETSEDRLAQAVVACHLAGMRSRSDIADIFDAGSSLVFTPGSMLAQVAVVDLDRPPPAADESLRLADRPATLSPRIAPAFGAAIDDPYQGPVR